MISATLDPRLFAAPSPTSTAGEFRAFVTTLLNWSRFADEPMARVWVSRNTPECLFSDNCYPLPPALRDAMKNSGVYEYDLNTIKMVFEKLLRLNPGFEDHYSFNDVLHSSLNTDPSVLGTGANPNLAADAGRCLVILAILSRYCTRILDGHGFATRELQHNTPIRISARVEIVEHTRPDLVALQLPATIEAEIRGCRDFDGFLAEINAAESLLEADHDDQARFAIRVSLHQSRLHRGQNCDWFEQPDFLMGAQFLSRARQCCGTDRNLAGLLLQSCVEAIDRFNLQRGHAIRIKKGGGAGQVEINSHKAQRHNVSADYHLHYWERADNRVELAWVSYPHDDMNIPNPK
jgi:hypothetical protein